MIAVRAAAFGAITVGMTASAHMAAGGQVPSPVALAVLATVSAAVGLPLLRRARRPGAALVPAAAAQVALHPAFDRLAAAPDLAGGMHLHHGTPTAMLVAHVVAAVVAAQLVTAVDPLLRRVRLPGLTLTVPAPPPDPARPVPRPSSGPSIAVLPLVVATVAPRRGPPLSAHSL